MFLEVSINMMHESSLTTVAMLAAYIESMNGHYLDLLVPFVEYCLPDSVGTKVSLKKVSEKMASEFGIENMPNNLVEAILKRYIKNNSHVCVTYKGQNYTVTRQKNNNDFDTRRQSIQTQMDLVTAKLREFIHDSNWKPTINSPKEMLLNFFRNYGLTFVNSNVEDLYTVSASEKDNFIVAKFILWTEKNDISAYNALISLTKGFLTYRAIYQIDEGEKQDHQSKLKNIKCFLDCSLIINLLDYDTPESKASIEALIGVIKRNGGEIWVFEHTIEEAQRLLSSYASTTDKMRFRLPGLKAKHYHDSFIRSIASDLPNIIEKKGIKSYSVPMDFINAEKSSELYTALRNRSCSETRSESDFFSISGIKHIRKKRTSRLIEHCSAILITQDLSLTRTINKQEKNSNHGISFAKLDTDMAALLWLQTFKAQPSIPEEILLSNAAAAEELSDEVRERAIELIASGERDGTLSPNMIQALRSDRLDEMMLADCTGNDPDCLTKDTFTQSLLEMLRPNIEQQNEMQKAEAEKQHKKEMDEMNRNHQEELAREREANALQVKRIEQDQKDIQYRNIDRNAIKKSKTCETILKWTIIIVSVLLATIICIVQVTDMINTYFNSNAQKTNWFYWVSRIIVIAAAVLTTIFLFTDKTCLIKKLTQKFGNRMYLFFRKRYERILQKLNCSDSHDSEP